MPRNAGAAVREGAAGIGDPVRNGNAQICRTSVARPRIPGGSACPIGAMQSIVARVSGAQNTMGDPLMVILQPTEWPKPRGFSHGVAVDGPGRWVVLAGQTGGDDKGEYQPEMAAQVATALRRIIKLLAEAGAGPEHIVRLTWYLTSRGEYEIRGCGDRGGVARDAGTKFSTLDAALHRWAGRCAGQGRDRSHGVCSDAISRIKRTTMLSRSGARQRDVGGFELGIGADHHGLPVAVRR